MKALYSLRGVFKGRDQRVLVRFRHEVLCAQFLAKVFERHDRMTNHHPGRSIAHDGPDANLSIAALAVSFAVLAVAFVPVWTRSSAGKRLLYGRAAFLAHSAFIFLSIGVIALAIDAPHGFKNASVFIDLIHVHQYR